MCAIAETRQFVINARTDAYAVNGLADAISRCQQYLGREPTSSSSTVSAHAKKSNKPSTRSMDPSR